MLNKYLLCCDFYCFVIGGVKTMLQLDSMYFAKKLESVLILFVNKDLRCRTGSEPHNQWIVHALELFCIRFPVYMYNIISLQLCDCTRLTLFTPMARYLGQWIQWAILTFSLTVAWTLNLVVVGLLFMCHNYCSVGLKWHYVTRKMVGQCYFRWLWLQPWHCDRLLPSVD